MIDEILQNPIFSYNTSFGVLQIVNWRNHMATAKRLSIKTPSIDKLIPIDPASPSELTRTYKVKRGNPRMFRKTLLGNPVIGRPAIELIRNGYLASMLKSVSSFFNVPDARIQNIARVSATTASRLEQKNAKIDAAATERVYRLSIVTRMAIDVFENQEAAIVWMRQSNNVLGDVAPLDLMDTEPGAAAVKQVLNAIATGGAA